MKWGLGHNYFQNNRFRLLHAGIGRAYSSSMVAKQRTAVEQWVWDEIFIRRFDACMRKGGKPQGCAQLAAEQANAAIEQRRTSQRNAK